jgi:hypothetical protein
LDHLKICFDRCFLSFIRSLWVVTLADLLRSFIRIFERRSLVFIYFSSDLLRKIVVVINLYAFLFIKDRCFLKPNSKIKLIIEHLASVWSSRTPEYSIAKSLFQKFFYHFSFPLYCLDFIIDVFLVILAII